MTVFTCLVVLTLVFLAGRFTAPGGGAFASGSTADTIKGHSWTIVKTTRVLFGTKVETQNGNGTDIPWPEDSYDVDLLFAGISSEVNLFVATSNHGVVKVAGSGESALNMWRRIKDGKQYALVLNSQNEVVAAVEAK
jgi:hypothetical protein